MKGRTEGPGFPVPWRSCADPPPLRRLSALCVGALVSLVAVLGAGRPAAGSQAYGSLNNFDCVNDTGVEAHGFDIELDDVVSTSITYTYDYNHYGVPTITQDNSDPAHPKVLVRYASKKNPDGTWAAYTAIPSGPIAPTQGHQFTNPSINFGGEHFGVGYYGTPSAVKYNWLIDDGTGNLVHGPPVNVATPTFTYVPPAPAAPPAVVAVIVPPPPPAPPPLEFGTAQWVKEIKTTAHNAGKVELNELVGDDPGKPQPWANGEAPEVEVEWQVMQTDFGQPDGGVRGKVVGAPEDLPGGNEVITRRYEFYKYIGPYDAETGEAMADTVAADGLHGVGTVTYADHFDPNTGEFVTVTTDLSKLVVVGDFFGAQMSGFDVAPNLGLVDHVQDGQVGDPYPDRRVVIPGGSPFIADVKSGTLPDGLTFDPVTGILSGSPTAPGVFTFTVEASDLSAALVSKAYTVTITGGGGVPATYTVTTSAAPAAGGTTTGDGVYNAGDSVTALATANPGYAFVNWTDGGTVISASASYTFTAGADRSLVANFARTYTVSTSASPAAGGITSGDGVYDEGDSVTVQATVHAGYAFASWTEGGTVVSLTPSYTFTAGADRSLVANFTPTAAVAVIATAASPLAGGATSGGGTYNVGDSVTVNATANPAYYFVAWKEGGTVVSTSHGYTFTAVANRSLTAKFAKDLYAPTSTCWRSRSPDADGWYRRPVQLSIAASDAESGVAAIHYRLDGGPDEVYAGPFVLSTDGKHIVSYWSVDNAGNVEKPHVKSADIGTTPPTISAVAAPSTLSHAAGSAAMVTISGHAADSLSGVDGGGTYSTSRSTPWPTSKPNGAFAIGADGSFSFQVPLDATKTGLTYTITLKAQDAAGNVGSTRVTVPVLP